TVSCRTPRYHGMRGVRGRTPRSAHDAEGGGGDERGWLRCEERHQDAAGLREGKTTALQISARDPLHRGTAEDGNRQDRPAGVDEDVAGHKLSVVPANAGTHNH